LMPGALFLTFGIYAYGLNLVDLPHLGMLAALHMMIGWVYLVVSPWFLPRSGEAVKTKGNPFAKEPEGKSKVKGPKE
jgi:ABC-type Fe3+ transport system permease subunit